MFNNDNKTGGGIQKQQHIMTVALTLFEKYGYDKISVDRIVKESKTSKGSFYQHFPSKSSIFMMRFMEMDKSYVNIYSQVRLEHHLAIDRLEAFCLSVYTSIEKELGKELMRVIYSAAIIDQKHTFFTSEDRKLFKIILEIIEDGEKDGSLEEIISKKQFFQVIIQTLLGTIYYWGLQYDNQSLVEIGTPLIQQIVKSYK